MKKWRDPRQYREEAARCRERAAATLDSADLRDSYLALAVQYERIADVLDQGEAVRALKLEAVDKLRGLAEQNTDLGPISAVWPMSWMKPPRRKKGNAERQRHADGSKITAGLG